MYSDLFDALGGGGGGGGGGNPGTSNARNSSTASDEPKPLLSFKAGRMELALQENGDFLVTPDTRRCQVNLNYSDDSNLVWEWFDRREKKVMDTIRITNPVKLIRADVPLSQDSNHNDNVYFWKLDSEWRMIWLQDKEEDPELIEKANKILKQPIKPDETPRSGSAASGVSAPSPGNASTSSVSTTTRQVDALSSILENLGMPQGREQADASGSTAPSASGAPASSGGTLTLADLQGAMSSVQNQQQNISPPGLQDIVTPDAIKSLLESEDVRNRLLEQLPEDQRNTAYLEENLRSPQVQQTLRSLTAALMPDDNGSMDGYHSVLANFQLDAAEGQKALSEGQSPIQAFLDCVLASIQKERGAEGSIELTDGVGSPGNQDEDGDDEMEEE